MTTDGAGLPSSGEDLLRLAEHAARAAGELVHRAREAARAEVVATKSSPTDLVTAMDRAAEDLIRGLLRERRPHDAVFGEEAGLSGPAGSAPADADRLTWVIDPIDGTVNYVYGLPMYSVSVAVVRGDPAVPGAWQPIAGCVHAPASGRTWTALAGGGAWLDGVPLVRPPVTAPARLRDALIGTGFGYLPERRREQVAELARLLPQIRDIRRIGSAAMDLCLVATGQLDGFYERGLNVWDVAAATLVLTECGLVSVGPRGRPASGELLVAGGADLAALLLAALGEA